MKQRVKGSNISFGKPQTVTYEKMTADEAEKYRREVQRQRKLCGLE